MFFSVFRVGAKIHFLNLGIFPTNHTPFFNHHLQTKGNFRPTTLACPPIHSPPTHPSPKTKIVLSKDFETKKKVPKKKTVQNGDRKEGLHVALPPGERVLRCSERRSLAGVDVVHFLEVPHGVHLRLLHVIPARTKRTVPNDSPSLFAAARYNFLW